MFLFPHSDGFTPLMVASLRNGGGPDCSLHGDEEEESGGDEPGPSVISDLIAQGANLMAQTDRTGETALHLAARYARADAAKRLLDAGADPNAHDNMGRTPLHAAVAADAQGVFQVNQLPDLPEGREVLKKPNTFLRFCDIYRRNDSNK